MLGLHPLPSLAQPMEFCQAQILRFAQHNTLFAMPGQQMHQQCLLGVKPVFSLIEYH
jgi:hypothetical protein